MIGIAYFSFIQFIIVGGQLQRRLIGINNTPISVIYIEPTRTKWLISRVFNRYDLAQSDTQNSRSYPIIGDGNCHIIMEHIALENSTMQEQANLITARSDKSSSSSASISETTRELFPTSNGGIGSGDDLDVSYRVYKRRWFGLAQLVLLNIIVSWDVSDLVFINVSTQWRHGMKFPYSTTSSYALRLVKYKEWIHLTK